MGNYPVRNTVFKGTAQYYATYRPAIPAQVISHLGTCFDLDGSGMLLDMGCGTGQSTFALAPLFKKASLLMWISKCLQKQRKDVLRISP